jgi:preprotein translocase subunit YajC
VSWSGACFRILRPILTSLRGPSLLICLDCEASVSCAVLMNLFDLLLLAQTASPPPDAPPQPSFLVSIMPLVFVFVIFYFLLIRPQQRRQKAHEKLVSAIKTGDKVVTSSGIHGIVANVKDKTILLKVADNVKIEFDRGSVASVEKSAEVAEEVK